MALETHSLFYFNYEVTDANQSLDFDEGSGEVTATVEIGSYSLTSLLDAIAAAMTDAGSMTYDVTVDRDTRLITISAASVFDLLAATGTHVATGIWDLIGFDAADLTGDDAYTGTNASGDSYATQFILQSYVPKENYIQAASAVVNKAASGIVEVIQFGQEQFIEADFRFITDRTIGGDSPIRNSNTGVSDFLTFMRFLTTNAPVEFMPNEGDTSEFSKVILESYPGFNDGTGFKLKELYDKGLPGFFETGVLKFRVVE